MDASVIAKLKGAFERDPLTTFFAIVVAGNRVHPTQVITVKGREVMVPKWGAEGWGWWGQLAHIIQDAAYAGSTPKKAVALSSALDGYLLNRPESLAGDPTFDPTQAVYIDVGPPTVKMPAGNVWIGGTLQSAGAVVADAAKWMRQNKGVVARSEERRVGKECRL